MKSCRSLVKILLACWLVCSSSASGKKRSVEQYEGTYSENIRDIKSYFQNLKVVNSEDIENVLGQVPPGKRAKITKNIPENANSTGSPARIIYVRANTREMAQRWVNSVIPTIAANKNRVDLCIPGLKWKDDSFDGQMCKTTDIDISKKKRKDKAQKCPALTKNAFRNMVSDKSKHLYNFAQFTPIVGDTYLADRELAFPCTYGADTTMLKCSTGGELSWKIVRPCTGTKPGQPTDIIVTPGDQKLTIHFTRLATDGGHPIDRYTVETTDGEHVSTPTGSSFEMASCINITGLTNGHLYEYHLKAHNAMGDSTVAVISGTPATSSSLPETRSSPFISLVSRPMEATLSIATPSKPPTANMCLLRLDRPSKSRG
eukprot:833055_1